MNNTLAVIKNMFYFFSSLEGLLILIPPIVVSYYFSSRLSIFYGLVEISVKDSEVFTNNQIFLINLVIPFNQMGYKEFL